MTATVGSLFSGYGGIEMAITTTTDSRVIWNCQYDPYDSKQYAARVLKHHYPDVPNIGDIINVVWESVPSVDILTAGFPCQPISNAGKKKGLEDDRWLWPYASEAIRIIRPKLVVLENVAAITSRGLPEVLGTLASIGFDAEWGCFRASDVGAPHPRDRWVCLAWDRQNSIGEWLGELVKPEKQITTGNSVDYSAQRADWGVYTSAIERWEKVINRKAPAIMETCPRKGGYRISPRFFEWMMGLPQGHVTGIPGIPRSAMIKALGNGVVPQQIEYAVRCLLDRSQLIGPTTTNP